MSCRWCIASLFFLSLVHSASHSQTLEGTFPEGGGPISVAAFGGDIEAVGLDFQSPSGGLIPVDGNDASPFTFFLANTPTQVVYGNLGNSVRIAEGSRLELSVGARAGTEDIEAFWGRGPIPVPFEVIGEGLAPRVQLRLDRNGNFVFRGSGEDLLGISIESPSGSIVPGEDDPAPFGLSLANTANEVSRGVLGSENSVKLESDLRVAASLAPNSAADVTYSYGLPGGALVGPPTAVS